MLNEDAVEALMQAHGFACVSLTGMTLAEQIALFRGAEVVAGGHGAGLTNVVFCQPGARVLELATTDYPNACMASLGRTRGLDYHVELFAADGRDLPQYRRSWQADLQQLAARLIAIAG
jgi:capsular polysaccharide biosynthesis protein